MNNQRDVRFGSQPDITARPINFRYSPKADIEQQSLHVRFVPKTDALDKRTALFNDLVCAAKERQGDRQPKRLRSLEIDDELESGGKLYR